MKQVILGAAIALVGALVAGVVGHSPVSVGQLSAVRTITVSGQANRKLVPDEAHLRVNLNSMKMKMAEAKEAHDEKLKALMDIAKAEGIEERKVRTESSTIQPIYEYVNPPVMPNAINNPQSTRVFHGYRVQTLIDVTVTDTAKVGAVMEKITNAGFEKEANTEWGNLLDLQYQVSEPEKKRDELLAEAIAAARTKADNMAKAAGASVVGVQQISEGSVSNYQPPMPMMAMAKMSMAGAAAEAAPVAPPSGEQELQANVSVIFELK